MFKNRLLEMALQVKGIWGKVQKGSKCRQEFHIP